MGNYSYMNAKYTRYVQGDGSVFTGNQIPFDVKYHYTLGGDVHFVSPQLAGGEVRIGATSPTKGKNTSRTKTTTIRSLPTTPGFRSREPACELDVARRVVAVSLWANNVNNKRYIINAVDLTAFYATVPEFLATDATGNNVNKMYVGDWNAPRMFGISFTYRH